MKLLIRLSRRRLTKIFSTLKKIKLKKKLKNKNVLAFSGLGNNDNFFNKLRKLKINLKVIKKFLIIIHILTMKY